MAKFEMYYPVKPAVVNQQFGMCLPNLCNIYKELGLTGGHNGIDYWAPDGYPVYAAHDGIVTFSGEDSSAGLGVVIRTEKQYDYNGIQAYFKTIYWHLKKGTIRVRAGESVKAGTLIALADNTGLSTGSHLHFGLKPVYQGELEWQWFNLEQDNGFKGAIDPAPYFLQGVHAVDVPNIVSKLHLIIEKLTLMLKNLTK